jgi:CrcB protein
MQSVLASCVLVGIGGTLGALARYGLSVWLQTAEGFPFGTFSANLLGCFAIGVIACFLSIGESLHEMQLVPEHFRLLLAVGFCGGFTTYSSFVLEMTAMIHRNELVMPFVYFVATTVGGFASFYLGLALTRALVLLLTRG